MLPPQQKLLSVFTEVKTKNNHFQCRTAVYQNEVKQGVTLVIALLDQVNASISGHFICLIMGNTLNVFQFQTLFQVTAEMYSLT